MAAKYCNIQLREMVEFLEGQQHPFQRIDPSKSIDLHNTKEVVFGRVVDRVLNNGMMIKLCIRVYTGIELGGQSRNVGKDAIRVCVVANKNGQVVGIGRAKRCNRVENWRDNLQQRLDDWGGLVEPFCPVCAAPMILHKPRPLGRRFKPFWGCVRYSGDPNNTCTGTMPAEEGDA